MLYSIHSIYIEYAFQGPTLLLFNLYFPFSKTGPPFRHVNLHIICFLCSYVILCFRYSESIGVPYSHVLQVQNTAPSAANAAHDNPIHKGQPHNGLVLWLPFVCRDRTCSTFFLCAASAGRST